jgi:general secretion pathway protein G
MNDRTHNPTHRRARGFTLMELLVVVLIIGLLTGIVGPRLARHIMKSEMTVAKAQIGSLDKGLQAFRIDMGRYPSTAEGLAVLLTAPAAERERWQGPYLSSAIPADPWGSPYRYQYPSTRGKDFDLLSLGKDRASGGSGDDADIAN